MTKDIEQCFEVLEEELFQLQDRGLEADFEALTEIKNYILTLEEQLKINSVDNKELLEIQDYYNETTHYIENEIKKMQ